MNETKPPGFGVMWLSVEKKQKEIGEGVGAVSAAAAVALIAAANAAAAASAAAIAPPLVHAQPSCPLLFTLAHPRSCSPLLPTFVRTHTHLPLFVLATPCLACLFTLVLAPSFVLGVTPTVPLIMLVHTLIHPATDKMH